MQEAQTRLTEKLRKEEEARKQEEQRRVPAQCELELKSRVVQLGDEAEVFVKVRNAKGEPIKGIDHSLCRVVLTGPGGVLPAQMKAARESAAGVLHFLSKPNVLGAWEAIALLEGKEMGRVALAVVPRSVDPTMCKVSGPGLQEIGMGLVAWLTIKAYDDLGKFLGPGNYAFSVKVSSLEFLQSPPVTATIRDNEDGTFSVSYEPRVHGKHQVTVLLNGNALVEVALHCDGASSGGH